ncbi:hypothetical protein [Rheinheimera sp. MMS21-TC3]|uniref:hypothetical protein n=1 Tax=Rheinheimera sp. MMS21-TC3 TaxID=3072790 RepID=UPI0028C3CFC0|nr:hypothetical protein [Rheinheimera sp. MMS21-TC3]WNO61537.1 hypothetical protein RDV63_11445 [Rheinheimera sp. MMS21-TC3]
MKRLIILLISSLFSVTAIAQDVTGYWRGILKFSPQFNIVLGLEVSTTPEGKRLVISSPNQGMTGLEPTTFSIDNNKLTFKDNKLNASFTGTFTGETLSGVFTQGGDVPVIFKRLTPEDVARLANERQWFGDLQISKFSSLPLVLNIAVIAEGYHVTLDSPKQESYAIPISTFNLSADKLSFKSAVLNASYEATWQQDAWQGTFVQGMAMPLTLKKKH